MGTKWTTSTEVLEIQITFHLTITQQIGYRSNGKTIYGNTPNMETVGNKTDYQTVCTWKKHDAMLPAHNSAVPMMPGRSRR